MIYFLLFCIAVILTYLVKTFAVYKSIVDIPNHRSSHDTPTPRGGGLAIVMIFYIGVFYFQESIETNLFYALLSGLLIAVISLIDDLVAISSKLRLMVQGATTLLALYLLGGIKAIDFIVVSLEGWWLNGLAFIFVLWLTNLYNFLDGIDGYAGAEAVLVGLGALLFLDQQLGAVIAVASLGFLIFNWQKASIFMGDVGSATLGFIFAILILSDLGGGNIYIWSVLLSLFWFDATLTLIRRYRNGEQIMQAHKKHAYQRLVQSGWSHQKVVLYAIAFNLLFLAALYMIDEVIIVFIVNLLALYGTVYVIDKKKSFV